MFVSMGRIVVRISLLKDGPSIGPFDSLTQYIHGCLPLSSIKIGSRVQTTEEGMANQTVALKPAYEVKCLSNALHGNSHHGRSFLS